MHDHDFDLVMAIAAEEAVDPTQRAAVDACLECSADLVAQRAALSALSEMSPAALEPMERQRLRAAVQEELNLVEPHTGKQPARSRPRFTWAWVGAGAMVLIGFVAVAGLFDGLTAGGDDAAETAALDRVNTTTTAAGIQESGGDQALTTTTAVGNRDGLSSTEDTEAPAAAPDLPYRFDFEAVDPDTLRELATLTPENAYAELGGSARTAGPVPLELELACEDAGLAEVGPASDSYPLFQGDYEGAAAYLWVYVTSDGPVTVVHDATTCAVVKILR
ncbi:MAG: hypothetical protein KJN71_07715 [Acidimicrobiia bacterium]|nr:hypothetical protein [Acidimicrobiia bacterium]